MLSTGPAFIKCSGNTSPSHQGLELLSHKSLSGLGGRDSFLWAGLFGPGREPSEHPGGAAEKRCITGEGGGLTEVGLGKESGLGSFLTGSPWQAA